MTIYTATGQYDDLVSFAQRLVEAGVQAFVTNALMVYAKSGDLDLIADMVKLTNLKLIECCQQNAEKATKKSSPVVRKMRRW